MHFRTPTGTRIEDTNQIAGEIEKEVRRIIPPGELAAIVDNIGQPFSAINLIYNNSGLVGSGDGDIYISLNPGHHATADYVRRLREILPRRFPGVTFSYPPADIVSQILNFGTPAPIDVQIASNNSDAANAFARQLLPQIRAIPGIADVRIQQSQTYPRTALRRRSLAHGPAWPDRKGRHHSAGNGAGGHRPDGAEFLAQSQDRGVLCDRVPDAGIPLGHHVRAAEPAGDAGGRRHAANAGRAGHNNTRADRRRGQPL